MNTANPPISPAKAWQRALEMTTGIARNPHRIFPVVIDDLAERFGDAKALLSERECMTYQVLAERSNRYARWALNQDLGKGEIVCLYMPNRPEYLAIWLGITRVGGVVSLLNTNLVGPGLAHCIDIAKPKHVIVASELVTTFTAVRLHLATDAKVWAHGDCDHRFPRIDREVERYSGEKLAKVEYRTLTIKDRALNIYTSGTTGFPKAANVSHYRVMLWSYWFAGMLDTQPNDRMYDCLPMYHSIGGVAALGAVLVNGGSAVVRERFSARGFWDDIVRWDCTLFQYIGELCRYLVNSAPHPLERGHQIRACCGNGLRLDVWNNFKARFQIPQILEFYAATEGNAPIYNVEGKPGAIGRIPAFLAHRFQLVLVKWNFAKATPFRDEQGYCRRCAHNEVGEAISRISDDASDLARRFEGYTDKRESDKKLLRDVFKSGDCWFSTGDLMRKDESGYFYFVDRIGDTFRWKGENVATSEVSDVITAFSGVKEANVYGVTIPGTDGRAGMAAVVIDSSFDLAAFRRHLGKCLPGYAQPIFLRLCSKIGVTTTFKYKKTDLIQEAYNPSITTDPIYFNDPEAEQFVPIDAALYARIQSGQVRF